ncbi:hypothetical protein [Mycobacterium tuberculosis]|uniref:hypothetical protein n=1 Tax=Mycobacterium tuberculosis TaxID=1773 RepID=UPI00070FBF56|nr:hypothetical protein [Mycobacterium tuberculosis]
MAISLRRAAGTAFEIEVDMPTSLAGNGVDLGAAIEVAGTFALETQRRVPDDGPFDELVAPASHALLVGHDASPSLRLGRLRPALDAQETPGAAASFT